MGDLVTLVSVPALGDFKLADEILFLAFMPSLVPAPTKITTTEKQDPGHHCADVLQTEISGVYVKYHNPQLSYRGNVFYETRSASLSMFPGQ